MVLCSVPLREDARKCKLTYSDRKRSRGGSWQRGVAKRHERTSESERKRLHLDYVDGFWDVNIHQNSSNQML